MVPDRPLAGRAQSVGVASPKGRLFGDRNVFDIGALPELQDNVWMLPPHGAHELAACGRSKMSVVDRLRHAACGLLGPQSNSWRVGREIGGAALQEKRVRELP